MVKRWLYAAALVGAIGCGGTSVPQDSGDGGSVNTDAAPDTAGGEAGADASLDAGLDARADAPGMDAAVDAPGDASPDVAADVASDTPRDAAPDAVTTDVVTTDAATGDVADAGQPCMPCVGQTISWGNQGGRVRFQDVSSLATCRSFTYTRTTFAGTPPPPPVTCTNEIPACGLAGTNVGDVGAAMADADVVRALAAAPVLFGRDLRPVDGTVFQIHVGTSLIEVGADCAGTAGCMAIPPGVARARAVLEAVTSEGLLRAPCPTSFP